MTGPAIFWFRRDLRLADNPGLDLAAATGRRIVALYVLDDAASGRWKMGGASRWWLHGSLAALGKAIARRGGRLILRSGDAGKVIRDLAAEVGAEGVFWNRRYEPFAVEQDKAIKAALRQKGIAAHSTNGSLVREPWELRKDGPANIFSPFHRAWMKPGLPAMPAADLRFARPDVAGDRLDDWGLLPTKPDWAEGLRESWEPGEAAASERAKAFVADAAESYGEDRHKFDDDGVSHLSPHLHFGEISPRRLLAMVGIGSAYARQLAWRDFAAQLLYFTPDLPTLEFKAEMRGFPWRQDPKALKAWQYGRTGYPLVDAGMRQLRRTGWMHNRARMVVASFLTRHLLLDWRHGQDWFWDELVDADLANNAMNWQWNAGSGTDPIGFRRIFNPVKQGEDLDRDGAYVRRWVPELSGFPNAWIHRPFDAPADVLDEAARSYPRPIVGHVEARARALRTAAEHRSEHREGDG